MAMKNFRELDVWQSGKDICLLVYKITGKFPKNEMYGVVSQMRRAAISVPSNIAEGFNRYHNKEFRQFLYIALGSCAELETQLEITHELNYFNTDEYGTLREKIVVLSKMLRNFIKKL